MYAFAKQKISTPRKKLEAATAAVETGIFEVLQHSANFGNIGTRVCILLNYCDDRYFFAV